MSNIPGLSPITPDIEDIRHSDDDAFKDTSAPDADDATEDEADHPASSPEPAPRD